MHTTLFEVMRLLEGSHVHFNIARESAFNVTIFATVVGKRIEITVDEDGTVDVAVFRGNEDVAVGMDAVRKAIEDDEA